VHKTVLFQVGDTPEVSAAHDTGVGERGVRRPRLGEVTSLQAYRLTVSMTYCSGGAVQ